MKKILFAFMALAFLLSACKTAVEPITVELSKNKAAESTLATIAKEVAFTVANTTSTDVEITWERQGTNDPAGFVYTINGAADNSGKITVAANTTVDVKLVVNPNGNQGTATGKVIFYDAINQGTTQKELEYRIETVASLYLIETHGSMTNSSRASRDMDYHMDVINHTLSPVTITWQKVDGANNPQGWTTTVCTDDECYAPYVVTKTMTLAPSDTVDFKGTFIPAGNVGTGTLDAIFYVPTDSVLTRTNQLMTHTANP